MSQLEIINRSSIIKNKYLNKKIKIHNGKSFIEIFVTNNMLNFKSGCFHATRKNCFYKKIK
jgi:ribosomal protein S19